MLNAIHQSKAKFPFHLYAVCIISNDKAGRCMTSTGIPCALTACLNAAAIFGRPLSQHVFPDHEQQRALNTLRYIHANPKTAGMRKGYFYVTATAVFNELPPTDLAECHPVFLFMGKASTPARSVTEKSVEGWRFAKPIISTWPAQKLPPGLSRSNRSFF